MNTLAFLGERIAFTITQFSVVATSTQIIGNSIETSTENKFMQTVAKVLQSANVVFITFWLTAFSATMLPAVMFPSLPVVFFGSIILGISPLLISFAAEKIFPNSKEKIAEFQKHYSTTLKVINILAAIFCLGTGMYYDYYGIYYDKDFATMALEFAALFSSACALYNRNVQPIRTAIA